MVPNPRPQSDEVFFDRPTIHAFFPTLTTTTTTTTTTFEDFAAKVAKRGININTAYLKQVVRNAYENRMDDEEGAINYVKRFVETRQKASETLKTRPLKSPGKPSLMYERRMGDDTDDEEETMMRARID